MKMNNRSNRYRINRHMFKNSLKYTKYKTCQYDGAYMY